jgi:hypothetical protein
MAFASALLRMHKERKLDDDDRKSVRATERERRDAEIEARAADAYERIYRHQNHWKDWMYLADGLMLGRRWALEKAGMQEPKGKGYNLAFSRWMSTRAWARDLDPPTRNDLFWCAEHRSEIEAWRDELDERERQKKNHPTHMKRAYAAAHKPPKEEDEGREGDQDGEPGGKKGTADEQALRQRNLELSQTIVKLKENPFPWWDGSVDQGARSMYDDRGDGRRADGKARLLIIALIKGFKDRFPNQAMQLLDEVIGLLRGPSEAVEAVAARETTKAIEAVAREGARQAKTVRRAGRMAKREAMSDQQRADRVKELRAQGLAADQIEAEIAKEGGR